MKWKPEELIWLKLLLPVRVVPKMRMPLYFSELPGTGAPIYIFPPPPLQNWTKLSALFSKA